MLGTSIAYFLIQAPATAYDCDLIGGNCRADGEKWWAFLGMVFCFAAFAVYMMYQIKSGGNQGLIEEVIEHQVLTGNVGIKTVFRNYLKSSVDGTLRVTDMLSGFWNITYHTTKFGFP